MRRTSIALAVVLALAPASSARADDGTGFHRTTPRASLAGSRNVVVIGVPGGRAWGVESELRPLPAADAVLVVRLAVSDPAVREAFVRVAYYGPAVARGRQLAIADSVPVGYGERALVSLELDPPPGAVAYRVRVLARLRDPIARSSDDAVAAVLLTASASRDRLRSLYSRLLP